jgi:membrane protein
MKSSARFGLNLVARFVRFFKHLNVGILVEMIHRSGQNRLPGLSAEIAYSAIFALFPAILTVFTAIGLLNIPESEFRNFLRQLHDIIPNEAMALIQEFLRQLRTGHNEGLFSLSFVVSIWVSSNVLGATMAALDQIHRIPRSRVRPFWKAKLVSIGLSLGTFLLFVIALLLIFISDLSVKLVAERSGTMSHNVFRLWHWLSLPIALGIVALTFGFIYRYGTSRWRKGTPIMPGAILATLLWAMLSGLFRLYVSHFGNYNQAYGAIGAVIVLLLWLYLSAFSMLLGSQLNVVVGEAMHRKRKRE